MRLCSVFLLLLLAPAAAAADATPPARKLVAVLPFEANQESEEQAAGVTSLVASHLAEDPRLNVVSQTDIRTMLSIEKQRAMMGLEGKCEEACLEELSALLGAQYVVTGRLDRFGKRYVVTAALFDSRARKSLARPKAEAARADTLPPAVRKMSEGLMAPLGASLQGAAGDPLFELETDPDAGQFSVGLRLGNSFIRQFSPLNPGVDLDLMYRVHHGWNGFLQVGFKLRRPEGPEGESGFSVVPSVLGVRRLYRLEESLQPYWGAGVGVQLAIGQYGIFTNTGALPTVVGLFGIRYRVADWFALSLEGGTNVAQMLLGFTGSGVGSGLNVDVTGGVSYLF